MLSLYVAVVFPNVPIMETIECPCDYIKNSELATSLQIVGRKGLLFSQTYNTQFKFNKQIRRQKDCSTIMSSPRSLLGNIFMKKQESCPLESSVKTLHLYKGFVDDICVPNHLTRINQLRNNFNSANANVKFTTKMELNNETAFLDIQLNRREDG